MYIHKYPHIMSVHSGKSYGRMYWVFHTLLLFAYDTDSRKSFTLVLLDLIAAFDHMLITSQLITCYCWTDCKTDLGSLVPLCLCSGTTCKAWIILSPLTIFKAGQHCLLYITRINTCNRLYSIYTCCQKTGFSEQHKLCRRYSTVHFSFTGWLWSH